MQQVVPFGLDTFGTRAVNGHVNIRVEDGDFARALIVVESISHSYCGIEGVMGE